MNKAQTVTLLMQGNLLRLGGEISLLISIIIVTYNSLKVLPNCVNALEKSFFAEEFEIIFVDNGSKDGTIEWLQEYEQGMTTSRSAFGSSRILLLKENRGYAYANNRGLEVSCGDAFLLLNPDAFVSVETIHQCYQKLSSDISIGAVGCRLQLGNGRLDRACRRSLPTLWNTFCRLSGLSLVFSGSAVFAKYNLTYLDECQSYDVEALSGAFMMVQRRAYESIGGLDEDYFMYGEDLDWCYRIRKSGMRIWYEGTTTATHLKGQNGGKQSIKTLRSFYDTMYLYYLKHHAKSYSMLFNQLVRMGLRFLYLLARMKRSFN